MVKNQLDSLEASQKFPVVKLAGMMITPTTPTDTPSIRNEQIIWSDTITPETATVKIYFYEEYLIKDVCKSTQKFPNCKIRRLFPLQLERLGQIGSLLDASSHLYKTICPSVGPSNLSSKSREFDILEQINDGGILGSIYTSLLYKIV